MPDSKNNRPYWWKIFCDTLSETGKVAVFSTMGGGLIGAALAYALGFAKREELRQMLFLIVVGAIAGALLEFAIRFFLVPAKMHKELDEKHEALKNQLSDRKILEFEIVHPGQIDLITGRRTYRIKVRNKHTSKAVKNLKVWLCEIKWPQPIESPMVMSGIIWPYQLPEKGSQNNSLAHELSGDSEKEFDLMFVSLTQYKRMINLAPFLPMKNIAASLVGSVYSNTAFNIDMLPRDDSKLIFKFKVSGGDGDVDTITESYALKVPPLLPENSIANQVENINALSGTFEKYLPAFEKTH